MRARIGIDSRLRLLARAVSLILLLVSVAAAGENLLEDPSFEEPKDRDKFGGVFAKWGGWKYEGECEFRVSNLARTGKHSLLMLGGAAPKIRAWGSNVVLEPGRYRIKVYIRGLEIGTGKWNQTTELAFEGKYIQLRKNGSFGWTPVTYVADVTEKKKKPFPSIGLMAPGYLWVDDMTIEKVGNDVALTPRPVIGVEEAPIKMPGKLGSGVVRCSECGYRNMPAWKQCYACGSDLTQLGAKVLPPKLLASFEDGKRTPFSSGDVVDQHATDGGKSLRWETSYISWGGKQDWTGYDFLKADFFVEGDKSVSLYVEIRDKETKGYWTRVNYNSLLLPGKNSFFIPTNQLVGEKSRPGRPLIRNAITRLVFSIGKANTPVYVDNIRLECDNPNEGSFPGLHAFDFGTASSPLLRGLTKITLATRYTKGRGYGLKNATVWHCYKPDVLQPDAVYRDFVNIEKGGFALDVPNGKYHVFVNIDCPGGFWGELPRYRERSILAEGIIVYEEEMDREKAIQKYFRFANQDDLYTENTFDKYLGQIFQEKEFDVEVTDGQLNIEFNGKNWTICLSCLVVFPLDKMEQGRKYLAILKGRRRKDFDNYFRRTLHVDKTPKPTLTGEDADLGYCIFNRDYMEDIYPNTKPKPGELTRRITGFAAAGEIEPLTFAIWPQKDLGKIKVVATDLTGPGIIPAANITVGYVSNRICRVQMDGSVYTIKPRYVMNTAALDLPKGMSRRFWANVNVPQDANPGKYTGEVKLLFADGKKDTIKAELEVICPVLAEADLPVGPWGLPIRVPWFSEEMGEYNKDMDRRCLALMRKYGMTSFSTGLNVRMNGKGRAMTLDFTHADRIMKQARDIGMQAFVNYGGTAVHGLNLYGYATPTNPKTYGFDNLGDLFKHVFSLMNQHAGEANWLPLYITVCDEPGGVNLSKCAINAALLKPCATDRIRFAGATSMRKGKDPDKDPHLPLIRSLDIANYNIHDVWSIGKARESGGWAFYNGGNRWTYGFYMFMLRQKYDMKFRLSWHWNCNAGDPYYALDCREDDYAWANANAKGELVTALQFERLREGVDDYRYLLTLKRLVEKNPDHASAAAAKKILDEVLSLVPGKDRGSAAIWPAENRGKYLRKTRLEVAQLIRKMSR